MAHRGAVISGKGSPRVYSKIGRSKINVLSQEILENYDRPTKGPTNHPHREVTLPNKYYR